MFRLAGAFDSRLYPADRDSARRLDTPSDQFARIVRVQPLRRVIGLLRPRRLIRFDQLDAAPVDHLQLAAA